MRIRNDDYNGDGTGLYAVTVFKDRDLTFRQLTPCPFEPDDLPPHYPPPGIIPRNPPPFDGMELEACIYDKNGHHVSTIFYRSAGGEWWFTGKQRAEGAIMAGVYLFGNPTPGKPLTWEEKFPYGV